jgi:hypothetical protein
LLLSIALITLGISTPSFADSRDYSSTTFTVPGGTVEMGWVSKAALAAHPYLYEQLGILTPAQREQSASAAAQPATSGTKCDGSVCAKVYGTGLTMTRIYTTADGNVGAPTPIGSRLKVKTLVMATF